MSGRSVSWYSRMEREKTRQEYEADEQPLPRYLRFMSVCCSEDGLISYLLTDLVFCMRYRVCLRQEVRNKSQLCRYAFSTDSKWNRHGLHGIAS